jgi:hypothetical protein
VTDTRPSIAELQRYDVSCRCGGEFSRVHNRTRGCPRHGNLPNDVVGIDSILTATPALLEVVAAALACAAAPCDPRCDGSMRGHVEECPALAVSWRLTDALAKVRE